MAPSRWIRACCCIALLASLAAPPAAADDGVFVRVRLVEPTAAPYAVRFGGYIHKVPWYLKKAVVPAGADRDKTKRIPAGQWTPWLDLGALNGTLLHGQMHRSGGIAEWPNVTIEPILPDWPSWRKPGPRPKWVIDIELATAADAAKVVKRWRETPAGARTSFLVSPTLAKDAAHLESLSEMQARHLRWAREACRGTRVSPKHHILQTSFYGATLSGAEVLHLLGFNVVGGQTDEIHAKFPALRRPGHTHRVAFGPAATREQIDALMAEHAKRQAAQKRPAVGEGVPFGFTDEICARPPIGTNTRALAHFHQWLAEKKIDPKTLGVRKLTDVVPIETPPVLKQRMKGGPAAEAAARRVFYYTSRFRQLAGTDRIRWHTEAYHKHFPGSKAWTSTLVADHPYFSGTGLGMGMDKPNFTWGNWPLALDWFDLARRRAVDLIGVEDWMGLQYMYGPNTTWEGFQLMGFQTAIMRSGGRDRLPIIAWITPSDETNLRLKTFSALCQGAKHFFYWTWGPTCFGTENYWSDLKGEYDGIASVARHLAAAEHILAPGKLRPTKVAMLYSISSDLWQPLGYVHMLERRATYLALVHKQYLVDFLTEEDIEAGRLKDYSVLYATDPCIATAAAKEITEWVRGGGALYGSCAAGSRNEFGEPAKGLSAAFGIKPDVTVTKQPGEYRVRGKLNGMKYIDTIHFEDDGGPLPASMGVVGAKVGFRPDKASVTQSFTSNGAPAMAAHPFEKGLGLYMAFCPGVSYLKDAKFVPDSLKEKYPQMHRALIGSAAGTVACLPPIRLSSEVVEAGVYDAPTGTAVVLANFTYKPIDKLNVTLPVKWKPKTVRSVENGPLEFRVTPVEDPETKATRAYVVECTTKLGLTDILLIEPDKE